MKKRISLTMDMNKKKAGVAILCCVLLLTLGIGATSAANTVNAEMQGSSITVPFGYSFKPDPEVYTQYSSYGIAISNDGERLLYNGQRVRLFVDEHSVTEAFYLDETGAVDLNVVRNTAGNITGIENITEEKAQEFRSAFFADDTNPNAKVNEMVRENVQETMQDIVGKNKLEQYSAYGITVSANGEILYYNGQRVKLLVDKLPNGSFETFWTDEAGTAKLSVVRNEAGQITAIEGITEKQTQK